MNKKLFAILSLLIFASMILAACAPAATEAPAEEAPAEEAPAVAIEAEEESLAGSITGDEQEEKTLDADDTTGANRAQDVEWDLQNTQQVLPTQSPEPSPVVIEYFSEEEIPDPYITPRLPTIRILEIIFGLGFIGFSAAALFKRRKSR